MKRRALITTLPLAMTFAGRAEASDFAEFLSRLRGRAVHEGIPASIADAALPGFSPNSRVIHLDSHQPEFTLTWAQYRERVVKQARIREGRTKLTGLREIFGTLRRRFGVPAAPIMGIWGIETDFGAIQGDFGVIESLATLAWFRNSHYFANEVIAAMKISARGDAPLTQLIGSWAGAMGQPQFMPSIYLSTAVSFTGNSRPDIWNSVPDTLASIANYLHKSHWVPGLPSSEPILIPGGFDTSLAGREHRLPLSRWRAMGVHRLANARALPASTEASVLLPDGPQGAAYLVYANFEAIRRYNPSDLYALAVGDLGHQITT